MTIIPHANSFPRRWMELVHFVSSIASLRYTPNQTTSSHIVNQYVAAVYYESRTTARTRQSSHSHAPRDARDDEITKTQNSNANSFDATFRRESAPARPPSAPFSPPIRAVALAHLEQRFRRRLDRDEAERGHRDHAREVPRAVKPSARAQ